MCAGTLCVTLVKKAFLIVKYRKPSIDLLKVQTQLDISAKFLLANVSLDFLSFSLALPTLEFLTW